MVILNNTHWTDPITSGFIINERLKFMKLPYFIRTVQWVMKERYGMNCETCFFKINFGIFTMLVLNENEVCAICSRIKSALEQFWCFRPRFCTVRLYWPGDNLTNVSSCDVRIMVPRGNLRNHGNHLLWNGPYNWSPYTDERSYFFIISSVVQYMHTFSTS